MATLYSFLVPISFDLNSFLERNPPGFPYFKREKLLYIIDLISQIPARIHDTSEDGDGYISINADVLRKSIGNNYHLYLDYLVRNGVLTTNYSFSRLQKRSRRYKFTKAYNTELKEHQENISAWLARKVYSTDMAVEGEDFAQIAAELAPILPKRTGEITLDIKSKFQRLMRNTYPEAFKWYTMDGLSINHTLAFEINKKLVSFKRERLEDLKRQWHKKEHIVITKNPFAQARAISYNIMDLRFKRYNARFDSNVFRQHSVLTSLQKTFRPLLTWNGEQLVCIDISNSQPYLLACILNSSFWETQNEMTSLTTLPYSQNYKDLYPIEDIITLCNSISSNQDVQTYRQSVLSGQFYEHMATLLASDSTQLERSEVKDIMFKVLFAKANAEEQPWAKVIRQFKSVFPSVYEFILKTKSNNYTALPVLLQRLESYIMYSKVLPAISRAYPNLPCFTIHDSVVILNGYQEAVKQIIQDEFARALLLIPRVKIDELNSEYLLEDVAIKSAYLDSMQQDYIVSMNMY